MFRLSDHIVGILNFATFLFSIPLLGGGLWLDRDCDHFLEWPVISVGFFLFLISLSGLLGACFEITWLLRIHFFAMFLLATLLFSFTVFALTVTSKGAGKAAYEGLHKEYRLQDYSHWLQKRVEKASNWDNIKRCIQEAKICKKLEEHSINEAAEQFYKKKLSPVQSGCCKPPTSCGFTYVTATYWTAPTTLMNTSVPDCATWDNNQDKLCYDCESCKAGVLARLNRDWRRIAVIDIVMAVILIAGILIGFLKLRDDEAESYYDERDYE